jgi:uncharacterized protein YciI
MKRNFFTLTIGIVLTVILATQCKTETERPSVNVDPLINANTYDTAMAKKLNADERGMKKYVMAFLKKGPKRDHDSFTAVNIQKGHMANIQRMADEGKLILAGPFMDDGDLRGIYIFNVETVEEAQELTKTDPAIQAGRLIMELHPWYGSAALQEVNGIHKRISKEDSK